MYRKPLVSIIIPIYNTEKYIKRSINSILNQTYTNIEIILINDGSTDKSGSICDEFAKKDSRIVVLHQQNTGVSAARNRGIECCTGEYVQFVDSDDMIEGKMTELLLYEHLKENCDLSICSYEIIGRANKKQYYKKKSTQEMNFYFQQKICTRD